MVEQLKILVVDDEPAIRATLKEFFTELGGYLVETAQDGQEGLEKVRQGSFDAAFFDLQMPRMTGIELLHHVKKVDNTLPVIIMTGFPSLDAAIDTMRHGASDFLTKPVRLAQLRVVLDRVLRERELLVENLRLQDQLRQKEAIERLNKELNKKVREQALLFNLAESVSLAQGSNDLYDHIVEQACAIIGARKALFFILDHSTQVLHCISGHGLNGRQVESVNARDDSLLGRCMRRGQPILHNVEPERLINVVSTNGDEVTANSLACLPVKIRGAAFGLLAVADKGQGGFTEDDLFLLQFMINKAGLSVENIALYESVLDNLYATLQSLVTAIEAKDSYTQQHSSRVTALAAMIATQMGLSEAELTSLRFAGSLHDIGKIGVPDNILTKPGRLTEEEYEAIKGHSTKGEGIISHIGLLPREKALILHHHERWDGNGYPDGLAGEQIPLLARIIAVADTFDAMTSDRPYRDGLPIEAAIEEIGANSGTQFDPVVVNSFMEIVEESDDLLATLEDSLSIRL